MLDTLKKLVSGKRVLVLGYGREGKSTLHRLLHAGGMKEVAVADKNPVEPETYGMLPVECITGPGYLDCLNRFDLVFKTPGIVLPKTPEAYSCRFLSQTELFCERYREQTVGITGTKGKSTTASLLYHILKEAGRDCLLAGNIGIPVFDMIEEITEQTIVVLELSCHQLEYMEVSPHRAALLNLHEEHLDHYGSMEKYVEAKSHIFRYQKPGDLFFCGEQCLEQGSPCQGRQIVVGDGDPDADIDLEGTRIIVKGPGGERESEFCIRKERTPLLGHHNYYDIAFVYGICRDLGITDDEFSAGLAGYQPLPHRLQFLGKKDGVKYYDDSISTIGDTTIQALRTLTDADTVLIGGMDRGIDYGDLIDYLSESEIPHIILMEETGKRIYQEILRYHPEFQRKERLVLTDHLGTAVRRAKELTRPGRSCVLSPASASYGIFRNFEERGDRFRELVFS